ncbi:hypothetical protein DC522_31465 [Microvirga sp. KLBC 81]|uniref:DnaB-like helicase N-terminal domain-containing protein n=1 Tax=Microvirga sp. KLBC 81 TaxID=1862707 RepID=UPI000D51D621|nr:DnaB-like helicase N-terminal domain-containing protein [Microvirga sp. KLBC 81]PVE20576.1 hypothetical protein DC522_31465 [Microvirga sp. KLBC 81]
MPDALARHSYYQFLIEGLLKPEIDAIIESVRNEDKELFNIDAEQAVLGAILIDNDAYYRASIIDPEDFSEDLHKRIFEVVRALIPSGEVVTPITIARLFGDQDLGNITLVKYLARLAAEAADITDVRGHVLTVYALSKYRSQMEVQEQKT